MSDKTSRLGIRTTWLTATALSAALGVVGFLVYRSREIPVDPLLTANFNSDPRKEAVYREPTGEGTYTLRIVDGQYVSGPINGKYFRTQEGTELARGLPGSARIEAIDANTDGNLDLAITNGNQYDILLGNGEGDFSLAPSTITKRR